MTTKHRFPARSLLAVLTLLPIAACGSLDADHNEGLVPLASWNASVWHPHAQAERVRLGHRVAFGSDSLELDRLERQRLADFLRQSKVTQLDQVIVTAPRGSDGSIDPTDLARLDTVLGELRGLGLKVAEGAGEASPLANNIGITIERAVVMQPNCSPEDEDLPSGVRPELQNGCATAFNLGAMVAFPEDLIEGRGISPADGAKGATSIERYRTDKVKKLDEERTSDL